MASALLNVVISVDSRCVLADESMGAPMRADPTLEMATDSGLPTSSQG